RRRLRGYALRCVLDRELERGAVDEQRVALALPALVVLHHEVEVTLVAARGVGRDLQLHLLLHALRRPGRVALHLLVLRAVGALRPDLDVQLSLRILALDPKLDVLAVRGPLEAPAGREDGAGLALFLGV